MYKRQVNSQINYCNKTYLFITLPPDVACRYTASNSLVFNTKGNAPSWFNNINIFSGNTNAASILIINHKP